MYLYNYKSPLGMMTASSDGEALTGLWFDGQRYFGEGTTKKKLDGKLQTLKEPTLNGQVLDGDALPVFRETGRWLDMYFSGHAPDFTPPLALAGTPFRMAVWKLLLEIPYGQTRSYGELAAVIAKQRGRAKMSAQAVGGAVGHNPISLIVPCHRVIGTDGSLTGYAGGVDLKARLLNMEKHTGNKKP